jgi:hypothetical protein
MVRIRRSEGIRATPRDGCEDRAAAVSLVSILARKERVFRPRFPRAPKRGLA